MLDSSLPPEIVRDFDTEKLIKWSNLSPSLKKRFTDLEEYISTMGSNFGKKYNRKRFTFSDFPPLNPVESSDIWVDKRYRVVRFFAENNWEFTRAAWFNDGNSGYVDPPKVDPSIPNPEEGPVYHPTQHTLNYMTYNSTSNAPVYNTAILPEYTSNGNISYSSFSTNTTLYIKLSGNVVSTNDSSVLGYVLGYIYPTKMQNGMAVEVQITQGAINSGRLYTYPISDRYMFGFDVDTNSHDVVFATTDSQKATAGAEGLPYMPPPFPYSYTYDDWVKFKDIKDPTQFHHQRAYEAFSGSYNIEMYFVTTY